MLKKQNLSTLTILLKIEERKIKDLTPLYNLRVRNTNQLSANMKSLVSKNQYVIGDKSYIKRRLVFKNGNYAVFPITNQLYMIGLHSLLGTIAHEMSCCT